MGPWNAEQIDQARSASFSTSLDFLEAYQKRDRDYEPLDPRKKSVRVHVNYRGRDFRFIFTGQKWLNELMPAEHPNRGGGGSIDFVKHLTGLGFVQAVKICLDANAATGER